jgi:hypothetical protein
MYILKLLTKYILYGLIKKLKSMGGDGWDNYIVSIIP